MLRNIVVLSAVAGLSAGITAAPAASAVPAVPADSAPRADSAEAASEPAVSAARAAAIRWTPCPAHDPSEGTRLRGLECGSLRVPVDHARPGGPQLTLALTRARHTDARHYQGVVLLNRGGPGAHGRDLPAMFAGAGAGAGAGGGRAARVAAAYDWIGFDPRGVGASTPAVVCAADYLDPARPKPDTVPRTPARELAWRSRAAAAAADCGSRYGALLPYMRTADSARDLESIRVALGVPRIGYLGYSYGTYLGAVYASLFPDRVRRMVLDSVVGPSGVWYAANLRQNVAFERRIRAFFAWVARHQGTYRLGGSARAVERAYYRARSRLAARPVDGRLGAVELDEAFLSGGYSSGVWPAHARALSGYLRRGDVTGLRAAWHPPVWRDRNNYAVYLAVQCRDAAWPRDWAVWHRDHWGLYRAGHRFETWNNAWYNAPCAYWPVAGGPAPVVRGARAGGSADGPPILLVQAALDAATPYPGAVETHRRFPSSRLVVQHGGGDHGVTLGGDRCADGHVWAFLGSGTLPASRRGPDASCRAGADPRPSGERR